MIQCCGNKNWIIKESLSCDKLATRFLKSKTADHLTAWCEYCYQFIMKNQFIADNTEEITQTKYQNYLLIK